MDRKQGRHVLDPMAVSCNWSKDRRRIALDLGYPINEIWLAQVDPNLPTWGALGTGQTRAEYLRRTWDQHVSAVVQRWGSDSTDILRLMRDMSMVGINQYNWGEHEEALWTLERVHGYDDYVDRLGRKLKDKPWAFDNTAYLVMTLAKLGRLDEAHGTLRSLRERIAQCDVPEENCLYDAEMIMVQTDHDLASLWDCIRKKELNQALVRLNQFKSGAPPSQAYDAGSVLSAGKALARAFFRAGRAARHQNRDSEHEIACYEAALQADPDCISALRDLALLMATSPDAEERNGDKAFSYAKRACDLTGYQDSSSLAALASACAENADFPQALHWQQEAIAHLPAGGSDLELKARLRLFESHEHLHLTKIAPLVAWWRFDMGDREKVRDASGHGLNGDLIGDAKVVNDPERGPVLALDGDADAVNCGQHAYLNTVHEMTVSVWVKMNQFDKRWQSVVGGGNFDLTRDRESRELVFDIGGPRIHPEEVSGVSKGSRALDDKQWHHIVGVYDGITTYRYVDGELDQKTPTKGFINTSRLPLTIGGGLDPNAKFPNHWNGWIDDLRIYNCGLNVGQIMALHRGREPRF